MTTFIKNLIGNDLVSSIIMSLIPLIELKGGIVFARSAGFSFFEAFGLCFLGSTLVFFPVFFLLKPILGWLKKTKVFGKLSLKVENFFNRRAEKVIEKRGNDTERRSVFYKCLGVFLFVAIPLPMTGVWTGTAIAVFLNLKFKDAILPVVLGNAVAGLIISVLAELLIDFWTIAALDYLLWGLFALAAIVLIVTLIVMFKGKPENPQDKNEGKK